MKAAGAALWVPLAKGQERTPAQSCQDILGVPRREAWRANLKLTLGAVRNHKPPCAVRLKPRKGGTNPICTISARLWEEVAFLLAFFKLGDLQEPHNNIICFSTEAADTWDTRTQRDFRRTHFCPMGLRWVPWDVRRRMKHKSNVLTWAFFASKGSIWRWWQTI